MRQRLTAFVCVIGLAYGTLALLAAGGPSVRTEDRNHDGRADVWRFYDVRGALVRIARDTNFDGRADRNEYYEAGALIRRETDRNFDDRIDLVEDFDRNQVRARTLADVDFDGVADLLVLYRAGTAAATFRAEPVTCGHAADRLSHADLSFAPSGAPPLSFGSSPFGLASLVDPFRRDAWFTPETRRGTSLTFVLSSAPAAVERAATSAKALAAGRDVAAVVAARPGRLVADHTPKRAPPDSTPPITL